MKRVLLFLVICGFFLSAQEENRGKQKSEDLKKEWKLTLRYGIDSTVVSLIEKLQAYNDETLTLDILERMKQSHNTQVLTNSFDYFISIENDHALERAKEIIEQFQMYEIELLRKVLQYLRLFADQSYITFLEPLLNDEEIRPDVLLTIGKIGSANDAPILEEWFAKTDSLPTKENILIALANLGSQSSLSFLLSTLVAPDLEAELVRYTIHALARCGEGNEEVYSKIKPFLQDGSDWTRVYAVSALGYFQDPHMENLLLSALRDSFWKVRIAAIEVSAKKRIPSLVSAIEYRVLHDPVQKVKLYGIQSMVDWKSEDMWRFLASIMSNEKASQLLRGEALIAILKEMPEIISPKDIEEVVQKQLADNTRVINRVANFLAKNTNKNYQNIAALLLKSNNPGVVIAAISYANHTHCIALRPQIEKLQDSGYQSIAYYAKQAFLKLSKN